MEELVSKDEDPCAGEPHEDDAEEHSEMNKILPLRWNRV